MGKIERGERNVTVLNVKRVAGALGLPIAALFRRARCLDQALIGGLCLRI